MKLVIISVRNSDNREIGRSPEENSNGMVFIDDTTWDQFFY